MNKINLNNHISGNKKAPVNLYYTNLRPILSSHNNSRNFKLRNNTDINVSNNLIKSNKWNISEMLDIKKKLNLTLKKRIAFVHNKQANKKISLANKHNINSFNEGIINKRFYLNNTVFNYKIFTSTKNSKKKLSINNRAYTNKGNMIRKKINFNNQSNNSMKNHKIVNQKKKRINPKIKNKIPFNINKININIINNNNININTIKTEGNIIKNKTIKKQKRKNFTLDKIPQFDELLKRNNIKEKDKDKDKEKDNKDKKPLPHKILNNNKLNIFSRKRNNTNYSLSNRLKNIIFNHDDISILSKKIIKNIKKIIIKKPSIVNDKSLKQKKIVPINYFQDYKKRNSSISKKITKDYPNFNFIKIKNLNENLRKKVKNNYLSQKQKRPYSKEEKSNILEKIKERPKNKLIKNKIFKITTKKVNLIEKILMKKIKKSKNMDIINKIISKSEIKNRRAKSNNKSKNNESEKIVLNDDKIFDKINKDKNDDCNIDDVLQNKKIPNGEIDNFDDLYSIVKTLNFNVFKKKDKVFCIDDNENYFNYKMKFEDFWRNQKKTNL